MASTRPKIEVRLWADRICYLSRQTRFSLVVFITIHSDKPITIVKHARSFDFGLLNLLVSEVIECFDTDSGERIPVLDSGLSLQLRSSNEGDISLMSFYDQKSQYLTFTTAESPRDYEFLFDSSQLLPDGNYTIQSKPSALKWWSHGSEEKILEHYASHGKPPLTETPALVCEPGNSVSFVTRANVPQPPKIEVSLSVPPTLSLSNNPPFEFSVSFTSYAAKPITVLAERHHARAFNSDIEIIDNNTRKRVAPDLIDDGNIDGSWQPEDFLRLVPEVCYVEQRTLNPTRPYSGLESLELDAEYSLLLPPSRWTWWSFDDLDEVMSYAGERGSGALGQVPSIDLVCRDEKVFRVVK